ncbi:Ig-like domain-containing protein [Nocardioides sp. LS1]|uniref:Ig-like domain-containing protein n=1 Tax=Nocardioides sp. LS1 TaxID=1027620 RepID=UPI000F61B91C|nr:Ig-like domain-containing protein [Nocardioides sp. LS1]GCD92301.1 hypothetical protein NLS1_43070 [Nocardioides sp. LS1]
MKISAISKRLATVGVATALAAGAMVGATATSASAVTGANTYTCAVPTAGNVPFPVNVSIPNLDNVNSLPAGFGVAEGLLNLGADHAIDLAIGVPAALVPTLSGLGVTGLSSPDMGFGFGSQSVPVSGLTLTGLVPQGDGSAIINAIGTNGAFTAPEAGTYDVTMPSAFTMVLATTALGAVPIPCSTADTPATLKSIEVTKNDSVTTAKPVKATVAKGTQAVVKSAVTGGFNTATGKVVAISGGKKVGTGTLNSLGKAKFKLAKMGVGSHKVLVKYLGDGYRNVSKAKVFTIKVVK